MHATARLVTLPVVVRDSHGNLLQDLAREDFSLEIDGRTTPIRYFDQDRDLPLTLGLLVDTSGSVRPVLDEERTASIAFLNQMLTTDVDRAFIIQFAGGTDLLADLTNSHPALEAALEQVGSPISVPAPAPGQSGRRQRAAGTTLYDAVFLASGQVMAHETRRKALILLTDGEDNGSMKSLEAGIEAAQRADTIVYAIYFNGDQASLGNVLGPPGRGGICIGPFCINPPGIPMGPSLSRGDGKPILERICAETGGRVFEISRKQKVADIYRQIGEELRAQYRMAFTPGQDLLSNPGYHHIQLSLPQQPDVRLQTRDGFYTGS